MPPATVRAMTADATSATLLHLPPYLPPGRLRGRPDDVDSPTDQARPALMWTSDAPCPDAGALWQRLNRDRTATGLRPLLLQYEEPEVNGPDSAGSPPVEADMYLRGEWDEYRTLRARWAAEPPEPPSFPDDGFDYSQLALDYDTAPPFETWPGLAPVGAPVNDPDTCAEAAAARAATEHRLTHLGLVPAARSADIPEAIGWAGANNHMTPGELSAVLRSWESRFGIRVVGLGHATLVVSVAARPSTPQQAEHLALEHYLACPDNVEQGMVSFADYAQGLLTADAWSFWWD
ncbi:protein of unknown function [Actinacidiphila guanduensis]|uniref:DUF4253 domain-containing protein n=2 Tax=Actinacidiphila guanduensis TaxID=310781 RepID=A0A1H0RFX4_9ACTN|nr:protein of unknown function [Actinacidiphila guanduensis]